MSLGFQSLFITMGQSVNSETLDLCSARASSLVSSLPGSTPCPPLPNPLHPTSVPSSPWPLEHGAPLLGLSLRFPSWKPATHSATRRPPYNLPDPGRAVLGRVSPLSVLGGCGFAASFPMVLFWRQTWQVCHHSLHPLAVLQMLRTNLYLLCRCKKGHSLLGTALH